MNLKELSQKLRLSQTTVSRALNGYPEVSVATRERVEAAARRYNYRPDFRAKSLATGRSMLIGHVIPISTQHEMVNPIFADFIAGASEVYSEAGYDIILSLVGDDSEERVYRDMSARGTVDGVIVHGPGHDDYRIPLLQAAGLPFVVHGRATARAEDYSWVDVDNKRSFRRATEFLADLGHTRFALVNGLESMDFARRRRQGFVEALEFRQLTVDPSMMFSREMTEEYGYSVARELFARPEPPTALLCASTITAFGIRRAADEAGLRLGRDVSLITHDDDVSYFRNGGDPLLFTALRSSVRQAGRRAAALLINQIRNPSEIHRELLETELILGRSTGPAPARATAPQVAQ